MSILLKTRSGFRPSLTAITFCCLMIVLLIAGGASRADVLGQVVVRSAATVCLIATLLLGARPDPRGAWPVLLLLGATLALPLLQLVPLPPAVWKALPGRGPFAELPLDGASQIWRPWALVPGAALNAAESLIVPLAVLLLMLAMPARDRRFLPALLLGLVFAAALLALVQFSKSFDNPFINESMVLVSGNFANRNHFALFLAIGYLLASVWAFGGERVRAWRAASGVGLMLIFALLILATGSRAGLVLVAIAFIVAMLLAGSGFRRFSRRLPKWVLPAAGVAFVAVMALTVFASIATDRATSFYRWSDVDMSDDMRRRSLPVVIAMITEYFPTGSGLGSFDAIFRMHEPLAMLKLTYFNHAHNDFLEIALDTGLPGMVLLTVAMGWGLVAGVCVWRAKPSQDVMLGRLGSTMLLLVLVASAFDYPARTPMIMAMLVIAALWLCWGERAAKVAASSLPMKDRHL